MIPPDATLDDYGSVIDESTRAVWPIVASCAPQGAILVGGTALALHLRHRSSRDLDLFCAEPFDHDQIEARLRAATTGYHRRTSGEVTFDCVVGNVLVQYVHAPDQRNIASPEVLDGMQVASLGDLFATILKAVGGRAELRDYFDVMCIEQQSGLDVADGIQLYLTRFGLSADHASVGHIVASLGYLADVEDDPYLRQSAGPDVRARVAAYWQQRQPRLLAELSDRLCGPEGLDIS